jgi:hypothetical protein
MTILGKEKLISNHRSAKAKGELKLDEMAIDRFRVNALVDF